MSRFPDTVFRFVGALPLVDKYGIEIPIFESLENESHYFTQRIKNSRIEAFDELEGFEFENLDTENPEIVKIGDEPFYSFNSPIGRHLGRLEDIRENLRVLARAEILEDSQLAQVASLLGDTTLLHATLYRQYLSFADDAKDSAEFFRLNNILREMTTLNQRNDNLTSILKDVHLKSDGKRILIGFPASVAPPLRIAVQEALASEARNSPAFNEETFETFTTQPGNPFAGLAECIQFDLPYTPHTLSRMKDRDLFIPEFLTNFGLRDPSTVDNLFSEIRKALADISPLGRMDEEFLNQIKLRLPVNLETALLISLLTMKAGKAINYEKWREFGKIRVCAFTLSNPTGTEDKPQNLLCINAAYDRYLRLPERDTAPFYAFLSFSTEGVVSDENFELGEFGFSNEYLSFALLSMLN